MRVERGSTINAAYDEFIAFSYSDVGNNWSFVNRQGLSVGAHEVNFQGTYNPAWGTATHFKVVITKPDGETISFDPNTVTNQSGWQGNTAEKANQAVSDLVTWISA